MRNVRPALAFALLLTIQSLCILPGQGEPTDTQAISTPITEATATSAPAASTAVVATSASAATETPQAESVGTINLVLAQVESGPRDRLQFLEGIKDFHSGDGVRVTGGGKGKLELNDGTRMTLFNETKMSEVIVTTSPPATDLFLQSQGFLGEVPEDGDFTARLPNGALILILGTQFFVVYNEENQVATVGNFDGTVLYTPPGGTEEELSPGRMVNIPAQGAVELMELSFTPEQFEVTVDSTGTPTAGLAALVQEYQIEPIVFTGEEVSRMTHDDRVTSVAFSPDGRYVVSGSDDSTARVWQVSTGEEVARMIYERGGWVGAVAFSPDGEYVVSAGWDGSVRVWGASTGKEVARMEHEGPVIAVAFSPDGKYVVSGSWDGTARVWEAATGNEVARMTHDAEVLDVAFSPDGSYVVSGSNDSSARVWEASTGEEVAHMSHKGAVNAVAFSPDGKYVVSGSADTSAIVWEASTGQEIARMVHRGEVRSLALSPDGVYVVSGGFDDTAIVWEASTGQEIARMTHEGSVNSLAFSPDGKFVVSLGNNTVRVWEALTGQEVARMVHENVVYEVAFSSEGSYVVSASADFTARVWRWQSK